MEVVSVARGRAMEEIEERMRRCFRYLAFGSLQNVAVMS